MVEKQVADVRARLFVPSPRGRSYAEINAWLMDRWHRGSQEADASDDPGQDSVAGVRGGAALPDGVPRSLRRLPRQRGRGVEDLPGALRQQPVQRLRPRGGDGRWTCGPTPTASSSARTARSSPSIPAASGRGEIAYDPWHYVPILQRKPGALRNGAPFKGLEVARCARPPADPSLRSRRRRPQFVRILAAVQEDGWKRSRRPVPRRSTAAPAAPTSCAPRARTRDVLNILARAAPAGAGGDRSDARGPAAAPPAGGRLPALRQPEGGRSWSAMRSWR